MTVRDRKPQKRKEIARYGRRGAFVRVVLETGGKYYRVLYTVDGERTTESFPPTGDGKRAALQFAEGIMEARALPASVKTIAPITLRDLFQRYMLSEDHWRPKTRINVTYRWGQFELYHGASMPAADVTLEMLDAWRRHLKVAGVQKAVKHGGLPAPMAFPQIRALLAVVKAVYRWGMMRDLIPPSKVPSYRFKAAKDEPKNEMREFSLSEYAKVRDELNPRNSREWRPFVAIVIAAMQGPRENAMLHLRWEDVTLLVDWTEQGPVFGGSIVWRAKYDKVGQEREQPLTHDAAEALWIALGWARHNEYTGPWVFFGVQERRREKDRPWSYQSAIRFLVGACKSAGVRRDRWQGYHAFRRGAAGNAAAISGSAKVGMHWIGDKDMRQSARYLRTRDAEMASVASGLSGNFKPENATKPQPNPDVETPTDQAGVVTSSNSEG